MRIEDQTIRDELKVILLELIKSEKEEPCSETSLRDITEMAQVLELLTR